MHGPRHLGDIALAFETVAREAEDEAKPSPITSPTSSSTASCISSATTTRPRTRREIMEALEVKALATLGIADPYRDMAA